MERIRLGIIMNGVKRDCPGRRRERAASGDAEFASLKDCAMETIRLGIIMNGGKRHCAAAGASAPRPVTPNSPR